MNDPINGWMLPASMFGLMFGMGLALTVEDFRRISKVPGPAIVGTLLQLVGMPVIGFGLALSFDLPPLLAVGVVIVAACPGGMMSNMVVHLGGANTALSVTLTAMATTVTLITLPLWVRAILTQVGGDGSIEIPLLQTALELGGLTIVPVMVGMVVRHFWPAATRFERPLSGIAAIGILGSLTYDGFMRPDPPTDLFVATLQPMFWLAVAAIVLGLGVPRLLGQSSADAVTIAVELCLKNGLLGMVVASTSFGVLEPSIPILAYSGYMLPASIILLTIHRVRERRAIGMQMSQG